MSFTPLRSLRNPDKTIIALFNYGGGLRGLVPAHIMSRIEEATGLRMTDMVDIFAGPSTGAILNAAMTLPHADNPARPRYRARHLVRFYEREGANIFPADRFREMRGIIHDFNNRTLKLSQMNALLRHGHYNPANLGRCLRALYGDARLSDSLASLIIPTYTIDGGQLEAVAEPGEEPSAPVHTQNNIKHGGRALWIKNIHDGNATPTPSVSTYDAVMASTAAPTYFPCHRLTLEYPGQPVHTYATIDGGIFDNPCVSYLGAIRRHIPADHKLIMIILGTGYTNKPVMAEDWNRYGALGIVDPVNDLPLINIFFHASESALIDSFADEMGDNLFVFNKSILASGNNGPSTQIDDASPENFNRLRLFHEEILEENRARFDALCHLLTAHYEQRKNPSGASSLMDRLLGRK